VIPLVDLAAQHREIADEVQAGWRSVVERSAFILGDEVKLEIGVEAVPAPTPAEAEKEIEAEVALESR